MPHMSETIQYLSFCDCLVSLSIMSSRFIHTAACVRGPSLVKGEQYPTVYVYHLLFIHLFINGYLDCFHLLVTVSNTSINMKMSIKYLFKSQLFSWVHIQNWKSWGLPWWFRGKESVCQYRRCGFHPWSGRTPLAAEQLSPSDTTTDPVLQSLGATTTEAHALQQEKSLKWETCTPQLEQPPLTATQTQHSQK